jgi:hypothetical protein
MQVLAPLITTPLPLPVPLPLPLPLPLRCQHPPRVLVDPTQSHTAPIAPCGTAASRHAPVATLPAPNPAPSLLCTFVYNAGMRRYGVNGTRSHTKPRDVTSVVSCLPAHLLVCPRAVFTPRPHLPFPLPFPLSLSLSTYCGLLAFSYYRFGPLLPMPAPLCFLHYVHATTHTYFYISPMPHA